MYIVTSSVDPRGHEGHVPRAHIKVRKTILLILNSLGVYNSIFIN